MENTENINVPFEHKATAPTSTTFVIKIKGAFRRGNLTPDQVADLQSEINKGAQLASAKGVFVIFDLSDLSYWDTMGINTVIDAIKNINSRHARRSGMILKKDSIPYVAASTRHAQEFASGKILWAETETQLLSSIHG